MKPETIEDIIERECRDAYPSDPDNNGVDEAGFEIPMDHNQEKREIFREGMEWMHEMIITGKINQSLITPKINNHVTDHA